MRRFSRRKERNLYPAAAGLVLILILIFLTIKSGLFNIKKIEVNILDNLSCTSEHQIKDASKLTGQNIFLINLSFIKEIKEKFICVKQVSLSKFFPDKVRLEVSIRQPQARLLKLSIESTASANLENIATPGAEQSPDAYLADDEVIFAKDLNYTQLTEIYLDDADLSLGREINTRVKKGLKFLEKLKTFGLNIRVSQITENFLVIFPSFHQPMMIFDLEKDINIQTASLQLILEKAKIDSGTYEFVDLRFDKPIIRLAPKKK